MVESWKRVKLSDIAELVNEKVSISKYSTNDYVSTENMLPDKSGITIASSLPTIEKTNSFKINDTLFSNIRTYFKKVWRATFDGISSNDVLVFRSKSEEILDPIFLYYVISSDNFISYTVRTSKGTKMPRGDKKAIMIYEFSLPPLPTQKKIAHILSTLDDKIELNRRMNETLEAMAQAIFKSWFVDFDPVHAKAAAKTEADLDQAAKELGISREILDLFPSEFVESEMGMIPKGWEADVLGNFAEILDSKRIPLSKNERTKRKGDIPYYGATSVMDYVDDYIFDEPLTLIGEDGSVVRDDGTPFMQYIWGKSWVNNHAHVLRSKSSLSTEAIYIALSKQNVTRFVTGAVQPKINQTNLKKIPIANPENELHEIYSRIIASFFAQIRNILDENKTFVKIRNILMPKLLSNGLDVSEIKIQKENMDCF